MFRLARRGKPEKPLLFLIQNNRTEPITVVLEPTAEEIELAPGEVAQAFDVMGDEDFPAEIVATEHGFTVWLNFEGYLLHKGEVVRNHPYDSDDTGNIRRLKALMSDIIATRGAWKWRNP